MLDKVVTALVSAGVALAAVKLSGGALASPGAGDLSPSKNKAVVRKLYREVWNQKDALKARAAAYQYISCLLYTSPSPRDGLLSRMPSSA